MVKILIREAKKNELPMTGHMDKEILAASTPSQPVVKGTSQSVLEMFSVQLSHARVDDQQRITSLEKSLENTKQSMQQDSQRLRMLQKDVLQKSLQSMVRLCVVAPTVNVSVGGTNNSTTPQNRWKKNNRSRGGQSPKSGGKGQTSLNCKSLMPHDDIKLIIEEQILPRFSTLYVQTEKGMAPDGKTDMSVWLSSLLVDMQTSIENHLKQVFAKKKKTPPNATQIEETLQK